MVAVMSVSCSSIKACLVHWKFSSKEGNPEIVKPGRHSQVLFAVAYLEHLTKSAKQGFIRLPRVPIA